MKERNHTFDLLCGLCILRMITLHAAGLCGMRGWVWCEKMMAWTFFFMAFFFFKAGYFNKTVAGDSWAYVKDRTRRLLVPYISWALIGNLVFFGLMVINLPMFMPYLEKRLEWSHLWMHSRVYGNAPLWFLFSFYVAYLAMHFMGKVRHLRWIILIFPFVSYWLYTAGNPLWMGLDNVFIGIFYFFLGRLWRIVVDRVKSDAAKERSRGWAKPLFIVSCAVMLLLFVHLNHVRHGEYDMSLNTFVQHADSAVLNTVLMLCGLSGILLVLPQRRVPFVNFIGEHSMVFFVLHYPVLLAYRVVHQLFRHPVHHHWDDFIFMLLLALVLCAWLVPYIEKVPILSGRWKKKV